MPLNYKILLKLSFGKETKPNLGGDASTVWNFCSLPISRQFAGKPAEVASSNVDSFLRLNPDSKTIL